MKNKSYDLYQLPFISDLKDMLIKKAMQKTESEAFIYTKGKKCISKTYGKLYQDVCALGTWLYSKGIQNKHIAIIGENSYEWLVCFFAIVCGENVAVPIDRELPGKEIARLLDKADVQVVIYSKSYSEVVEEALEMVGEDIVAYPMADMDDFMIEGETQIKSGVTSFVQCQIEGKKMCCIMFTSGTSGASKGVMLSHENIAEDINSSCQLFRLTGNTIAVLPFHHAFGLVVAVFMVLNYGYAVYINKSLKTISKDIQRARPQTMFLVPMFIENFDKQIWAMARKEGKEKQLRRMMKFNNCLLKLGIDWRKKMFSVVREAFGGKTEYIICGGAPLLDKYIKEFRCWGIEILNGYGTTECAPCAAVNRNDYHKDGTVGLSVPGVVIKIDENGEVMIKGPIVMQGYYKEPIATDNVMKNGWYKTGDLGFIDDDGFLTLTGRSKNLIILSNGENVSPEELETEFLNYEEVQEVLVYEENGMIVAEIYPNGEWMNMQSHFEEIGKLINCNRPLYKQVGKVCLRDIEFPKNTSKKILRYK